MLLYEMFPVHYASFIFFVEIHPKYLSFDGACKTVAHNWDECERLGRCLHLNITSGVRSQTVLFELTSSIQIIHMLSSKEGLISLILVAYFNHICKTETGRF